MFERRSCPNDVCDADQNVVDDDREVPERMPVGAQQNKVFDLFSVALLQTEDGVIERGLPFLGRSKRMTNGCRSRLALDSSRERSRNGFVTFPWRAASAVTCSTVASSRSSFGERSR